MMPLHPRRNMEEWISHFRGKYPIVGQLVNEGDVETCLLYTSDAADE